MPEEQDVDADHDGHQREYIKHDACLPSHRSTVLLEDGGDRLAGTLLGRSTRAGMQAFGAPSGLLAVVAVLGCAWVAPPGALGAVGDLNFTGCIGELTGCATASGDGLDDPNAVAVSSDGSSVYAASFSSVTEFSRNSSSGALTFSGCIGDGAECTATDPSDALRFVSSVTVSPDGRNVYAASADEDVLAMFSRNASTGALTYTGCIGKLKGCTTTTPAEAVDDPFSVAVSADGSSVYAASEDSELIDVFSRNTSTGALTFAGCNGALAKCTPTKPADALDFPEAVALSPDGSSVYVGSFVMDTFSRNSSTGALTSTGCIGDLAECTATTPAAAAEGLESVAVSPDGSNVYATSVDSSVVDTFARNTSSGALTFTGCIGELKECTATTPSNAIDAPTSVAISADGSSVYAASSESNVIDVFSRNSSSGALTFTGCIGKLAKCTATTPGEAVSQPESVALSADGSSVYAASHDSDAIDEFSRVLPPVLCANVAGSVAFDTPITIALSCTDADPVPLTLATVANPAHGTLGAISPSGQVTYTPALGYSGPDSFSYMASDSQGSSNTATATLTIAAPAPSLLSLPPSPLVTKATFADQRITLTTPSPLLCTMPGAKLAVTLSSARIAGSKAAKLRFSSANFFLDKGVKHTHKKTIHTRNGRKKTVIVITYSANAVAHHVPVTLELSTAALKAGTNTLTVKLSYRETKTKHGHKTTVTVTKTLTAKFTVC